MNVGMAAEETEAPAASSAETDASTWTDGAINRQLANLYYAAGDPGSYGGVERLYVRARLEYSRQP